MSAAVFSPERLAHLRGGICDLIHGGYDASFDEERFNELALEAHAFQRAANRVVERLAPPSVATWRDIPLVPTELFARHVVATFDPATAIRVFVSSGTTRARRGRHHYDDLTFYRASALAGARWVMGGARYRVESLVAPTETSSLGTMARWMEENLSEPTAAPALLIGTAFHYVELIDRGEPRPLHPASIIVETGGYKGKSREMTREELHAGIAEIFGVARDRIIGEYGMCEISTPLWERPGERNYRIPPWARVRTLDPETLEDAAEGVVAIYDLANLHSSVGVMTGDLGALVAGRLCLHGRLASLPAKGCSLMVAPGRPSVSDMHIVTLLTHENSDRR